jgi:uncharacterized protein (DUF2062 family)
MRMTPRPQRPFWQNLKRRARLSFIIPLLRSTHAPEYAARGVAVGIFWAFTPLMPFQIYLLGLTWVIARKLAPLDFHPLIALAWVFVTNALTLLPVYFVFYLTGQLVLGRWDDLTGYSAFHEQWQAIAASGSGLSDAVATLADTVVGPFGTTLLVGCLPYALGGAWAGYAVSVRMLRRVSARRNRNGDRRSVPSED